MAPGGAFAQPFASPLKLPLRADGDALTACRASAGCWENECGRNPESSTSAAFGEGRGEVLRYRAAGREAVRGDRWESRLASETNADTRRQAQDKWGEQAGGRGATRADGRSFSSTGGFFAAICGTVGVGWGCHDAVVEKRTSKRLVCGVRRMLGLMHAAPMRRRATKRIGWLAGSAQVGGCRAAKAPTHCQLASTCATYPGWVQAGACRPLLSPGCRCAACCTALAARRLSVPSQTT